MQMITENQPKQQGRESLSVLVVTDLEALRTVVNELPDGKVLSIPLEGMVISNGKKTE